MPRCRSSSIQSLVVARACRRALTAPASSMAPENSRNFSVRVVLPASGWLMMANVRRVATSAASVGVHGGGCGGRSWCGVHAVPGAYPMATIRSMARRARTATSSGHGHDVLHVAQRIAQLLERDHLHVAADGVLADGLEDRVRCGLAQAVQDARLGRDAQPRRVGLAGVSDHALGRQDVGPVVGERHRLAGAAALGVDQQVGGRVLGRHPVDVLGPDARMDVALAHPDGQLAAGDPFQPQAQEHVRQEQDLAVGGDGIDDRLGIARRAAVVRLGLHRGRGVDVRHDDRIGVLRLPGHAAAPR